MVSMNFLYIRLIGKSMKNTISHKKIVLKTKQFLNQMVLCFLPQISVDTHIYNRELKNFCTYAEYMLSIKAFT